jgi:uncharacterized glyoxalase superfamily protein PhnB
MAKTKKSKPRAQAKATAKAKSRNSAAKRSPQKPVAKGLHLLSAAVSLTVDDIAASMTWYCDVLGFTVKDRWEHNGVLLGGELVAGDGTLYIGADDWKKGRDRTKGEGVRVYLYVKGPKDIDRLAAAIQTRGGTLASEPKDQWGARSFDLVDPTGFKITVSSQM